MNNPRVQTGEFEFDYQLNFYQPSQQVFQKYLEWSETKNKHIKNIVLAFFGGRSDSE